MKSYLCLSSGRYSWIVAAYHMLTHSTTQQSAPPLLPSSLLSCVITCFFPFLSFAFTHKPTPGLRLTSSRISRLPFNLISSLDCSPNPFSTLPGFSLFFHSPPHLLTCSFDIFLLTSPCLCHSVRSGANLVAWQQVDIRAFQGWDQTKNKALWW